MSMPISSVELDSSIQDTLAEFKQIDEESSVLSAKREKLRSDLLNYLNVMDAMQGTVDGKVVISRSLVDQMRLDTVRLRKDEPALAQTYGKRVTFWVLRVK